jgi:uncharacterized SAM-binding protein YcdF (DUF218 family)
MILRLFALLVLAYALGFVLFAVTLGNPAGADAKPTDAVVVITGGAGRIEHGLDVLSAHKAKRMLVAGADPLVTKPDLIRVVGGNDRLMRCCVDLGSESVDTRSNAEEAGRWMASRGYRSLRLITSDWHMRRANYEYSRAHGKRYAITTDAVRGSPGFKTLFGEYNKYVLRRISVLLEI